MTNALVFLETWLIGAAMVGALFYFGFGITRLLLPRTLAPHGLVLMPLSGMALVIVWDYIALFFNFNLTQATYALVLVALALNVWGVLRERRTDGVSLRAQFLAQWRPTPWVWLLALVAFAASVAPLWRYGYATIIGENWDYEFYLPLADYLRAFSTAQLVNAPPNPLLTTLLSRHILPLPMGFTYLHASLNTLLNLDALETFAILLAVLHGLGVVSANLFFRVTLKMSERAALFATALLALNGLLLWFTYWNFGLHLASLALLPAALVVSIHALEAVAPTARLDWRAILAASFFLGALNVTYHPALIAAGLPLVVYGLYLVVTRADRGRVLVTGGAIIALTLVFSFPMLWHLDDFRREYYGRTPLAIGLREFVPLSDGYGFSLAVLELAVGHTVPTPWLYDLIARLWTVAAPLLTSVAVVLSIYALLRLRRDPERRAVWYSIVGASVLYVLIFRLPFLRPYPYGFLKSLSLVSYVLLALAVEGAEQFLISDFRFLISNRRVKRYAIAVLAVVALTITALTFALSLEQYFKPAPPFFNADALKLRELRALIPNGSSVLLTDRAQVQEIPMALAAYVLRDANVHGNVTTGYGGLENAPAGELDDYALLARGESPALRGYASPALWSNETFALHRRGSDAEYQATLNAQTTAPAPLRLTIGANSIDVGSKTLSEPASTRGVNLTFATFIPQRVEISDGAQTQTVELAPGLSIVTLPAVKTPGTLTLTPHVPQDILNSAKVTLPHDFPDAEVRLFLPTAQLRDASGGGAPTVTSDSDTLLIRCTSATAGELNARCFVVNPGGKELTWRWIVRGTYEGTREERVIAQEETRAAPRAQIDFSAQSRGGLGAIQFDNGASVSFEPQTIPDGSYRGDLELLDGDVLLARVPLYQFQIKEGGQSMMRSSPHDGELVIIEP